MNDDEYLKQNPEFDARQKEKHSTPVASVANTKQKKAPVSNGFTLYPALGCLSFFLLLLLMIIAEPAKPFWGGEAVACAIVLITFFTSAIYLFMGDVVEYLKEIIKILKKRQ